MSQRRQSTNEYSLGYRHQVSPLFQPESPPPSPPRHRDVAYFTSELNGSTTYTFPLRRVGRSVDCDLPHALAERFNDMAFVSEDSRDVASPPVASSFEECKALLKSGIPTISIDSDSAAVGPPTLWMKRTSLTSIASHAPSDASTFTSIVNAKHLVTPQIQRLVSAFTSRAKALKDRIAQPPTPSTDSSIRDERQAPDPPPLTLRYDLEETAQTGRWKWPSTFHPQSSVYIAWLVVVTMAFVYNLWGIPLRASFPYQDDHNVHQWLAVDYLSDLIYLLDTVVIRPRLRFLRDGVWIEDLAECRANYTRSLSFKVDLLSLTPLDLLYMHFGLQTPLLRLSRVIRILPFWELFDRLDLLVASPFAIRIGRTLFYMLYLIHLNACAYYTFSLMVGLGADTFVFQGDGNAYLRCFYFAMKTATKIGKNPKPVNNTDRTFMIFNWLIGVFACAAILGQMRDIMAAADKGVNEYRDRVDRTVQLMSRLHLPSGVQDRVRMWFNYNWSLQKTLDEKSSLLELPHNMQLDIAMNVHVDTLGKVTLFHDCDRGLLRDLVLRLKSVVYLPNDLVCKKGEIGREMYIIKSGQVQVMGGPNNDQVLVTLSEGSVFGEISLLAAGGCNRRMADVRSKGFSNLFVLSKGDLNEVLLDHPEAQKVLQRKAKKLAKKSSKRQVCEDGQPIIVPQPRRPSTPKLINTVLKIMAPQSETTQLLARSSRSLSLQSDATVSSSTGCDSASPNTLDRAKPAVTISAEEDGHTALSEELLLKPGDLETASSGRPKLRQTKSFPLFSKRITPTGDRWTDNNEEAGVEQE